MHFPHRIMWAFGVFYKAMWACKFVCICRAVHSTLELLGKKQNEQVLTGALFLYVLVTFFWIVFLSVVWKRHRPSDQYYTQYLILAFIQKRNSICWQKEGTRMQSVYTIYIVIQKNHLVTMVTQLHLQNKKKSFPVLQFLFKMWNMAATHSLEVKYNTVSFCHFLVQTMRNEPHVWMQPWALQAAFVAMFLQVHLN